MSRLSNGTIRFFQFVGKDKTDLNSDVICIFKKHYMESDIIGLLPTFIINDDVECYMHTSVSAGVKLQLWSFVVSSEIIKNSPIIFRSSKDVGKSPRQIIVSHSWMVWEMNRERVFLGTLPKEYHFVDIGGVYAPKHVIYRMETGTQPDKYYPIY